MVTSFYSQAQSPAPSPLAVQSQGDQPSPVLDFFLVISPGGFVSLANAGIYLYHLLLPSALSVLQFYKSSSLLQHS